MKYTKLLILLVFVSFLLPSCTVEKRLYNKGFHVENNFLKKEKIERVEIHLNTNEFLAKKTSETEEEKNLPPQPIQQEKKAKEISKKEKTEQECDTIYFKNGTKILCDIRYAGNDEVVYKICGDPKGYNQHSKTSEIEAIKYANGNSKTIENEYDYVTEKSYVDDTAEAIETRKKSMWSFVFGMLGLIFYSVSFIGIIGALGFPCFILAIVLGKSALKTYKEKPHYAGKGFAYAGYALGLSMLILTILAAILIVLLLIAFII